MKVRHLAFVSCAAIYSAASVYAQVTYQRLISAENESGNWMIYSGTYCSWRYSKLGQIFAA